ncbi:MAG: tRNA (guanosine(37)-N1)-methyltransferase TrmD, partial [Spirochaetia bacterium]|nr:tRNA (guanosine(37)-N1)-methyltransferase TrmD [Spirochaetia bacterium]
MKIQIVTLFPAMVEGFFTNSIMKRAVERGTIEYEIIDFRAFATDKHHSCDDVP